MSEKMGVGEHWLYHSTFANNVAVISSRGLVPSRKSHYEDEWEKWSLGKVFFTESCAAAGFYAKGVFRKILGERRHAPDPVLLRIRREDLPDAVKDHVVLWKGDTPQYDLYVKRTVPPEALEIWMPWFGEWMPVSLAAERFSGMETNMDEPTELRVDSTSDSDDWATA